MKKSILKPIVRNSNGQLYFELKIGIVTLVIQTVDTFPSNIYVFNLPVLNRPVTITIKIFGIGVFTIGFNHTEQIPI